MNYKFCPNCGQKLNITDKFCSNCGAKQLAMQSDENVNDANGLSGRDDLSDSPHDVENDSQRNGQELVDHSYPDEKRQDQKIGAQSLHQYAQQDVSDQNDKPEQFYQSPASVQGQQFQQQRQEERRSWRPYNESGQPGFFNSFNIFCSSFSNVNKCMGRADFWWGELGLSLISYLIMACIYLAVLITVPNEIGSYAYSVIYIIFNVIIAVVGITAVIDRLHDTGHSGWNYCWSLTVIGAFYVLYLLFQPTNWNEKRWIRINE